MNREEKLLCAGYLLKSPTRSKDKSNLPMFWKLRWCVLAKVTHRTSYTADIRLILSYYEDKQTYINHDAPKGRLNITNCISIQSCYKPQAGFDHIFSIGWSGDRHVKLSAQSCEQKFTWITSLYNNKFQTEIKGIRRSEVITGNNPGRERSRKKSSSFDNPEYNSQFEKSRKASEPTYPVGYLESINGGPLLRGPSVTASISSNDSRRSMPLPALPDESISSCDKNNFKNKSKSLTNKPSGMNSFKRKEKLRSVSFNESDQEHHDYDTLFMLCESCELEFGKKKTSLVRRLSHKNRTLLKNEGHQIEVQQKEADKTTGQFNEADVIFDEGPANSIRPSQCDSNNIYVDIDDNWLARVKLLMGNFHEAEIDSNDGDYDSNYGDDDSNDGDDDIYVKMNIFTHAPSLPVLENVASVQPDMAPPSPRPPLPPREAVAGKELVDSRLEEAGDNRRSRDVEADSTANDAQVPVIGSTVSQDVAIDQVSDCEKANLTDSTAVDVPTCTDCLSSSDSYSITLMHAIHHVPATASATSQDDPSVTTTPATSMATSAAIQDGSGTAVAESGSVKHMATRQTLSSETVAKHELNLTKIPDLTTIGSVQENPAITTLNAKTETNFHSNNKTAMHINTSCCLQPDSDHSQTSLPNNWELTTITDDSFETPL